MALSPEPRGGAGEDKGSALPEQRRPAGRLGLSGRPGREGSDLNQSLIPEFTLRSPRGAEGAESLFRVQRLIPREAACREVGWGSDRGGLSILS